MKHIFSVLFFIVTGVGFTLAQDDVPVVTKKFLVQNAQVVTQPGTVIPGGSILIEDGIIVDVGTNIEAGPDVEIINADSMYIYAGFVAPLSHVGIPNSRDDQERPEIDRPGYPPNDVAGITPEKPVRLDYSAKDKEISAFRQQGFGVAHAVSREGMMPGKGAVISLNEKVFNKAVIRADASMFSQLEGAQRVFPATAIGVMAKWREMYRRAEIAISYEDMYNQNPLNKRRPVYDEATAGLFSVVRLETPVFFKAEQHNDIYRALELQNDLGFNIVLSEVKQADQASEDIASHKATTLLSLDLPKAEDAKEDEEASEEKIALEKRKSESIQSYTSQAAIMAEKKLPFSFSYLDVKAKDVHANIRRMIKAGLSEEDALSSLTTSAAEVLGLSDRLGTLEVGKIGNLVMTTAPLFSEDAKIKMVFVDGMRYEYDVKEKKNSEANADVAAVIEGVWDYEIDIPGMTPTGTMTFTQDGDSFSIDLTNNQAPGEIINVDDVALDGAEMSFEYDIDAGGTTVSVTTDITFDGETFEGEVGVANFGSFPVSGEKQSTPE